jgi:hypothetical protein
MTPPAKSTFLLNQALLRSSVRFGLVSALFLSRTLASVQLDIPPRLQWDENSGYCGEVSIQSIALFYGAYISQYRIRAIIDPSQEQDTLVPHNSGPIFDALRLNYAAWNSNSARPQYQPFLVWVKGHLAQKHPVIFDVFSQGLDDPDYDHIITATGFTSPDTTIYHDTDTLVFNDNYAATPFTRTFGSLPDTRSMNGNGAAYTYCLPRDFDYGCAVTGIKDDSGTALPVYVAVDQWNEPNLVLSAAPVPMSAVVTIRSLTAGSDYVLLRYNSYQTVPTNNYLASSYSKATYFSATGATRSINDTFLSDATVIYRCIPVSLVPPVITSFDATTTTLTLRFTTQTNRTYYVEACDDLASAQWTKVATNLVGTGGPLTYTGTRTQGALRRFLRVGVKLP